MGRKKFTTCIGSIDPIAVHSIASCAELINCGAREPFSVIGVLTRNALQAPDEFWRFFETLGATQVAFNVEEAEGINDIVISIGKRLG